MRKLHFAGVAFVAFVAFSTACGLGACVGDGPAPLADDTDSATPGADSAGTDRSPPADSSSTDAADAGPKRFCDTQGPLAGVTNFFCADFDGASLNEGWTKSNLPDAGGAFTKNTDIFHSAPNSFGNTGSASLEWDSLDAMVFKEVNTTFQMNVSTLGGVVAPQSGNVTLLSIDTGDTNLTLNYSQGATVTGTANYTGYYVTVIACPSACAIAAHPITTPFTPNVWTQVSLTWTNSGNVTITFNGISVYAETAPFPTSTKVMTSLGLVRHDPAPAIPRVAFDDVMISIRR